MPPAAPGTEEPAHAFEPALLSSTAHDSPGYGRRRREAVTDAERWGVALGYHDAAGTWHEPPATTVEAILSSMGAAPGVAHPDETVDDLTVRLDHPLPTVAAGLLTLEDGTTVRIDGTLPPDLPSGYHHLRSEVGASVRS